MQLPIAIPLPFFFIFLLFKLVIILITPFALGAIVRLRSQGKRKETNSAQKSDKTNPPPSPGPDGEDKPEDSYWTRFKKWCSDHSVAIGLGVITLTMALIYVYREEISQLINGQDSPEQKKDTSPPPAEEKEKATSMFESTVKVNNRTFINYFPFFDKEKKLDHNTLLIKAIDFAEDYRQVKEHFKQHPSEDPRVTLCLNFIEKYQGPLLSLERPGTDMDKAKRQLETLAGAPKECMRMFIQFMQSEPANTESSNLLRT